VLRWRREWGLDSQREEGAGGESRGVGEERSGFEGPASGVDGGHDAQEEDADKDDDDEFGDFEEPQEHARLMTPLPPHDAAAPAQTSLVALPWPPGQEGGGRQGVRAAWHLALLQGLAGASLQPAGPSASAGASVGVSGGGSGTAASLAPLAGLRRALLPHMEAAAQDLVRCGPLRDRLGPGRGPAPAERSGRPRAGSHDAPPRLPRGGGGEGALYDGVVGNGSNGSSGIGNGVGRGVGGGAGGSFGVTEGNCGAAGEGAGGIPMSPPSSSAQIPASLSPSLAGGGGGGGKC